MAQVVGPDAPESLAVVCGHHDQEVSAAEPAEALQHPSDRAIRVADLPVVGRRRVATKRGQPLGVGSVHPVGRVRIDQNDVGEDSPLAPDAGQRLEQELLDPARGDLLPGVALAPEPDEFQLVRGYNT